MNVRFHRPANVFHPGVLTVLLFKRLQKRHDFGVGVNADEGAEFFRLGVHNLFGMINPGEEF